jgi:hypothetical protein
LSLCSRPMAMRSSRLSPVGAAARSDFVAAAGKTGASRATEPTEYSGGRGGASTSATSTSGSDRTARRRADGRPSASRAGTVAPDDNARSRKRRARDRAAQDQPGTNSPRQSEDRRASQGARRTDSSVIAKASGQDPRPKTSAPPPRPITTPTREPARTRPSPREDQVAPHFLCRPRWIR